eukprot:TRINITY_DN68862_c0_g1_i1.p1 TRINITY_DN68862_c0_g1~~TRINITY_DN68862_c0_g1_i1.p1  ORF type:complete len:376 (-),score=88.97 TRINITY_DN68862_c0_g1_i1:75-1202(-)
MAAIIPAVVALLVAIVAFVAYRVDYEDLRGALWDAIDGRTYEWFVQDCSSAELAAEEEDAEKASKLQHVHVVYAADADGFRGLLTSMLSLSRHLEAPGACTIHLIVHGADFEQAARLVECLQVELEDTLPALPTFRIHELRPLGLNISSFREAWQEVWPSGSAFFTPMSFVQLYLHEYLPDVPRAIWLHCETLVKADVGKLYRTRMSAPVAAALDLKTITWRSGFERALEDVNDTVLNNVPDIDARVFSAGVLVIDLERWQLEDLTAKLEVWIGWAYGVKLVQLAMNLELRDRIDVLDWRWNVAGLMLKPPRHCLDEAHILHWPGPTKPWDENLTARLLDLYENITKPFALPSCRYRENLVMLDSDPDVFMPPEG